MTTASPLPGERPSRCLRFPKPLLPSLLSSRMPRAPSFHVGAQRSALSSGSGGNAIAEPSGWSGSSASRDFHHTSAGLFAKASRPSFVFSIDSQNATNVFPVPAPEIGGGMVHPSHDGRWYVYSTLSTGGAAGPLNCNL